MKLKITGIIFVVFAMLFASCSANGGEKKEPEMTHTSSVQTENEMQASEPPQTQSTQTQSAQTQSTQATRGYTQVYVPAPIPAVPQAQSIMVTEPETDTVSTTQRPAVTAPKPSETHADGTTAQTDELLTEMTTEEIQTFPGTEMTTVATEPSTQAPAGSVTDKLPQLEPGESDRYLEAVEDELLRLMNNDRVLSGAGKLAMRDDLREMARYKSLHMLRYDYFDHTAPDGSNTFEWMKTVGISYSAAGENIASVPALAVNVNSAGATAAYIYDMWRNSSGHNANMMNKNFDFVGIGVVCDGMRIMATQVFIKSK